jgi:uncharacterized protein
MTPEGTEVPAEVVIENNVAEHRFEARLPSGVAELQYRYGGSGTLVLVHTEVPPALEGRSIGARLVRAALEYARANGLTVVPLCPFVTVFIARHPEFQSLVRR